MAIDALRRPILERMNTNYLGLAVVTISDRDGVVLLKVINDEASDLDSTTRASFLGNFTTCTENASRMINTADFIPAEVQHQAGNFMVTKFKQVTLYQQAMHNVIVNIIGRNEECVLGQMMSFAQELDPFVEKVAQQCIE